MSTTKQTVASVEPREQNVFYYVKIKGENGCSFAPDWSLSGDGMTWGITQCQEQIKKLRNHVYDGRRIYANADLQIIRETRIMEEVKGA